MYEASPDAELHLHGGHTTYRIVVLQVVCLSAAGLIAAITLLASMFRLPASGITPEWIGTTLDPVIAAIGCGAALALALARPSRRRLAGTQTLAFAAALPAFFNLLNWLHTSPSGIEAFLLPGRGSTHLAAMPPIVAIALVLLALEICLIRSSSGIASIVADCLASALGLLVLSMASGWLFSVAHVFDTPYVDQTPPSAVAILVLLTLVAFSIRARHGAFDILVGSGIGSRIARALTPIVLVLPFLREAGRARIIRLHLLPEHSEAAVLAAIAAVISFAMVLLIARHIRRMERQINRLSLSDELTGLYNLRGFRLLADQAMRLALRSQAPFSVLFVDLDGLKEINDTYGHKAGSALLVETAELLKATFRESDVIARIGGDEFAVAGQFCQNGLQGAATRLEDQALLTKVESSGGRSLSLSIGYSTTSDHRRPTLQNLLDEADANMYGHKRRKRLQAS